MNFAFSSSPHIRAKATTRSIMADVLLATVPALVVGFLMFGPRALMVVLVCVLSCVAFECLVRVAQRRHQTVGDLSAVVTGVLLALSLPASVSYVAVVCGAFFAVVVVKALFGGLGRNLVNPALAARAFLFLFPQEMVRYPTPGVSLSLGNTVDLISTATPLHHMRIPALPESSLWDMFLGRIGGCIGEISVLAILLGLGYLLLRRVISFRIPVFYLATVALLTLLFPRTESSALVWMGYQVMGGGLLFGAVFMATDYATSPVTARGQVLYAVGCGLLTVLIRYNGIYPEGVTYAILTMNLFARTIDRFGVKRRFGLGKGAAK